MQRGGVHPREKTGPVEQDAPAAATVPMLATGDGGDPDKDAQHSVSYNAMELISSHAKVGGLVVLTLATIVVAMMLVHSRTHPEAFVAALTTAQTVALLISISLIMWYLGFRALVIVDAARFGGEDTSTQYLSEESQKVVAAGAEFSAYMLLFFLCDRTSTLDRTGKVYERDQFWFLWTLLTLTALATLTKAKPPTVKPGDGATAAPATELPPPAPLQQEEFHVSHLQRDQTEEWKGWMQIMFLWYHYFNAKDIYNAIRLYIAAYVWMTGFGNFSYYYVRKDFSLGRFCQMQWRLNFMVICTCAILNNDYMLYYICMLHTTFTVMIYACLGIMNKYNATTTGITAKILILFAISFLVWDFNEGFIFYKLFWPLKWIVKYQDPYKADRPEMQEWFFRSWLDHYVWIFGMICAYNHPNIEQWLQRLDRLPKRTGNAVKILIASVTLLGVKLYYDYVFSLPKKEYNQLHPYTSFIPIALYIILRNISAAARRYHLHLFEYCGKITLETYIAQFHIWMGTTGINGAPKKLLTILPSEWRLMNFLIFSGLLLYVSFRLFHCTNVLKSFVLPSKVPNAVLQRNVVFLFCSTGLLLMYAWVLESLLGAYANA